MGVCGGGGGGAVSSGGGYSDLKSFGLHFHPDKKNCNLTKIPNATAFMTFYKKGQSRMYTCFIRSHNERGFLAPVIRLTTI